MTTKPVVVVTGSTRGIGYGLAEAFLQRGCRVVVNGRSGESVDRALASLPADPDCLHGTPADVSKPAEAQRLWNEAVERFGRVDIWVNNAGVEHRRVPLWDLTPEEMEAVIDTNLTGLMAACAIAVRGMAEQPDGGHIYNMEGLGSDGRLAPNLSVYGTTKAALTYLTRALTAETEDIPVKVSRLNPGMVVTDLLKASITPGREEQATRIFNILADRVEVVAPWLADRILRNDKSGAHIVWLTTPKIIIRFLLAPFRKRDLFNDEA